MHAVEQGTPFETVVEARAAVRPADGPVRAARAGRAQGRRARARHASRRVPRPVLRERTPCTSSPSYGHILEKDGKGKVTGYDKKALEIVAKHRPATRRRCTADELRTRVEDGLADEIHRMLDDGVVAAAEDIDLCMILGAGWPFQMGGVTPYLDRVGASERVFGDTFHHPPIRGVA